MTFELVGFDVTFNADMELFDGTMIIGGADSPIKLLQVDASVENLFVNGKPFVHQSPDSVVQDFLEPSTLSYMLEPLRPERVFQSAQ